MHNLCCSGDHGSRAHTKIIIFSPCISDQCDYSVPPADIIFWAGVCMSDWRDFIYVHIFFRHFAFCQKFSNRSRVIVQEMRVKRNYIPHLTLLSFWKAVKRENIGADKTFGRLPRAQVENKIIKLRYFCIEILPNTFFADNWVLYVLVCSERVLQGDGYSGHRGLTGVLLRSGFSAARPLVSHSIPEPALCPLPPQPHKHL